eukprot:1989929-Prymnesium_polylepis.1
MISSDSARDGARGGPSATTGMPPPRLIRPHGWCKTSTRCETRGSSRSELHRGRRGRGRARVSRRRHAPRGAPRVV